VNPEAAIPIRDRARGWLVPATYEHVEELGRTMLPADVEMCRAGGYEPAEAVFRMWWPALNKFTFLAGGKVAAMFGTCAQPKHHKTAELLKRTPEGQLWCFTGEHVALAPNAWVDKFKFAVHELLKHFDALHAYIPVHNGQMVRLAEHVGGELEGPFPFGPKHELFWKYCVR
jgi:hypothetical protein